MRSLYSFLLISSYVFMMVMNSAANILPINGRNTGEISDSLPNYFVPSGFTFSIWGLIYLLLLVYVVFSVRDLRRDGAMVLSASKTMMINMLLNGLWIVVWHYGFYLVSLLVMLGILTSLIRLHLLLYSDGSWYLKVPVGTYLGWISVATVANVTAVFVSMGWEGSSETGMMISSAMILVVTVLASYMVRVRLDIPFGLVAIWALYGISTKQQYDTVLSPGRIAAFSLIFVAIITLVQIFIFFRGRPRDTAH